MNKKQVQKRVLQNGKPIPLEAFTWCERTNTFSSALSNLVINFTGLFGYTFKTGGGCKFDTGAGCMFHFSGWMKVPEGMETAV